MPGVIIRDSQDDSLQLTDSELEYDSEYLRLPQNLIASEMLLDGYEEDYTSYSITNGSRANNTTAGEFKQGLQSIKVTTNVAAESYLGHGSFAWNLANSERDFWFWFYSHDFANLAGCKSQLGQGGDVAIRAEVYLYEHAGWNLIRLMQSDFALIGGFDWDTVVDYYRTSTMAKPAVSTNVSYDYISSSLRIPALIFTFDDGSPTSYTIAFDYMQSKNMKGTLYAITDNVGAVGYVTLAQITEMYAAGWDIANHTDDHTDLTTVAQAVAQAHVADAKTALDAWGFTRASDHVSYPFGAYNDTVVAAMIAESMLTGRTIATARYPVLPFDQPHRIELNKQFGNTLSLAAAKTWLDGIITRKEIGITLFHSLVETPLNATQWGIDDFREFVDYAISQNIPCLTMSELYALQSGPVMVRMPG